MRLSGAAGVAVAGADSVLVEPNLVEVVRREIVLRRWPERLNGFKIAMLSDFHYDPIFSVHPLRDSIELVNELDPDLIVLTGDFVTVPLFSRWNEAAAAGAEPCAALLAEMKSRHGSWAVLGNHDYYTSPERVSAALQSHGISVLANGATPIEHDGARFWLSGVNDVLSWTADLDEAIGEIPRDEPTILLAHEPDFADSVVGRPVDLQLSGHSHGGQVRLPFMPPLYLPKLARKYYWGLYQLGPLTLYTNRGIGTMGLPVRLNCPPEITLLTMTRGNVS